MQPFFRRRFDCATVFRPDQDVPQFAPGIEARKGRDALGGSVHESPASKAQRRTGAGEFGQGCREYCRLCRQLDN
jgi:hypothetical protein